MKSLNNLNVRVIGNGKNALVLLHGFLFDKNVWGDFSEELALHYTLVFFDMPGHGAAQPFSDGEGFEDFAHEVKQVMHELGIQTFAVLGHSMGGYAALALAKVYPQSITALVLINSTALADSEERKAQRLRTLSLIRNNARRFYQSFIPTLFHIKDEEKIAHLIAQAANHDVEGIVRAVEVMRDRKDYSEALNVTRIPILFYAGKFDGLINKEHYIMIAAALRHSKIVISDHSAHMSFIEEPEACAAAVKRFLELHLTH